MWIVGVTGALGSGKSAQTRFLSQRGIPVFSADDYVHHILNSDKDVIKKVKTLWPDAFHQGKIDRHKLGEIVLQSPQCLELLEQIIYPELALQLKMFIQKNQYDNSKIVVLDIPLLMEVGLDNYCHIVILLTSPLFIRKRRVLRRKGMTEKKFKAMSSHQMTDDERRKRADFIIPTGREKACAVRKMEEIIDRLLHLPSPRWNGRWPTKLKKDIYGKGNRFRHRNNRI
jgi:dephospho-CoA kinase